MAAVTRRFLDTNILVYAYDTTDADKHAAAQDVLRPGRTDHLIISTQVLTEFYAVVTSKLRPPIAADDARTIVRSLGELEVVGHDAALVITAIERASRDQLSVWDALIVESALRADCAELLTEDLNTGQYLDGLTVVNPLEAGAD